VPDELVGSPRTLHRGQTNTVELLSDDEDSAQESSLEPPPAYDLQPQEVDIDQDGFHASAIASCGFTDFTISDNPTEEN
jgi:hypothetical protein